jgi:hypothetical protein
MSRSTRNSLNLQWRRLLLRDAPSPQLWPRWDVEESLMDEFKTFSFATRP